MVIFSGEICARTESRAQVYKKRYLVPSAIPKLVYLLSQVLNPVLQSWYNLKVGPLGQEETVQYHPPEASVIDGIANIGIF